MNLVTHLLKKDLRRTRPLIALWLLILLVNALLAATGRSTTHSAQVLFGIIDRTAPTLQLLLLAVFVPYLILEEPLVGTTAFWLSRPLSRPLLLRAKALYVLLVFLLPPLVVEVVVLLGNGFTVHDIALALPQVLLHLLNWIAPLMLLAALVPSFARFAIVGVSVAVVASLFGMVEPLIRPLFASDYLRNISTTALRTMDRSTILGTELLCIFLVSGLVIYQYLARNTRRTIIASAVVALLLSLAQISWSWDFLARRLPSIPPFDLAKVQIGMATLNANDYGGGDDGPPWKEFSGELEVLGIPPEYVLTVERADSRLQISGGEMLPANPVGESGVVVNPEALENPVQSPVVNLRGQLRYVTNIAKVSAETFSRLQDKPITLSSELKLRLAKYVVTARMPAAVGARVDRGSSHILLTQILRDQTGVDLLVHERGSNLLFGPPNPYEIIDFYDQRPILYVLRNKVRNEAVLQKQNWNGFVPESASSILFNRKLSIGFGSDPDRMEITPDLTPAWLADAELIRLKLVPVCTFTKTLEPESFKLSGSSRIKWRRDRGDVKVSSLLDEVKLPEHASKQQVRDYLRALQIALQRQEANHSEQDVLLSKLLKVGPDNLDVLIDERSDHGSRFQWTLQDAIAHLVRPQDKALVLDSLEIDPELIGVVVKQGWVADAHATLAREIALRKQGLPSQWPLVLASLNDPATYGDLVWYFINTYDRGHLFAAIKDLPGIDLAKAVDAAWKKTRLDPHRAQETIAAAAQFGHPDAIDVAVKLIDTGDDSYGGVVLATEMLKHYTPATGDKKAVVAWVKAHRDKLVFDPVGKKFVLTE